jgi:hypothetical protein
MDEENDIFQRDGRRWYSTVECFNCSIFKSKTKATNKRYLLVLNGIIMERYKSLMEAKKMGMLWFTEAVKEKLLNPK